MTTLIHEAKALLFTTLVSLIALIGAPAHAVTLTDTTAGDFAAGTPGVCHIGETGDGDVLLAPTEVAEFLTTDVALPPGWLAHLWNPPGTAVVSGGTVTVDSARVNPEPIPGGSYGPGRSLEFVATFDAAPFQHAGFGGGNHLPPGEVYNTNPWAIFSTGSSGASLTMRVWGDNAVGNINAAPLLINVCAGNQLGGPCPCPNTTCLGETHTYRIDWNLNDTVDWYVDGVYVHQTSLAASAVPPVFAGDTLQGPMRPAISDFSTTAPVVITDWLRMSPYAGACAFDSQILDGGFGASWNTLADTSATPVGTAVAFETRTGNTATPDGTWSPFAAVLGGNIGSPNARYLQYRASLSTSDVDETPEVAQVDVDYTACTPTGSGEAICNGIDDDCDGQVDEDYVATPTNCGIGACAAAGTLQCVGGSLVDTCTPGAPAPDDATCDGIDDDCSGTADEDYVPTPTNCGVGECAATGQLQCVAGSPTDNCTPGTPVAEMCNGLDDNCDGAADEGNPGSGAFCSTGLDGVCDAGITDCQGGSLACVQQVFPSAEMCNGLDDDCDGAVDEGNPQGGGSCSTGNPGICDPGTVNCLGGNLLCVPDNSPSAEVCDGADNDCDGSTDEGLGQTTCGVGECEVTVDNCVGGIPQTCTPGTPGTETCDGLDNNCDGSADEGNPGGGGTCNTGNQGICSAGTDECQSGAIVCVQNEVAGPEACDSLDNDCDGVVDDDCSCAAAPESGCFTAQRAQLQIKTKTDPTKNQLKWKWQRGVETTQADLGDPTTSTTYALCIYDSTATVPVLVSSVVVGPNTAWQSKAPKGFNYKDKAGTEDGVQKGKLKVGAAGKSQAQIGAKGAALPLPLPFGGGEFFDQDPNVVVQLINTDGKCWTSTFTAPSKNEEDQYKAKVK